MTEEQFFSYSLHVQQERHYHPNWAFVIFKAKFDKWVTKAQKKGTQAKEPTKEYLDWLDRYQQGWIASMKQ